MSIRLIHLTDPHLTSLEESSLWALRGKRWSGYLSWRRRRRFIHRADVLERLTAAVRDEDPVQVLVTGDLVHVGLAAEIDAAAEWLRSLGPPERVMLVPGNHDAYAADSWAAFAPAWQPYLGIRGVGDEPEAAFPTCRRIDGNDPVTLLGLSSARPTPLFMAYGRLGAGQLARLDAALAEAPGFRCVLLHHPPLPAMASWRKGLHDAAALAAMLRKHRAHLVLHGHVHDNVYRRSGDLRVYGTASASSVGGKSCAAYRVFEIAAGGEGWQVDMRLVGVSPDGARRILERETWRTR